MRKQARRDSALSWVRSETRVAVKSYAKRYGVDRYTAYDDLTAIGFPLPAAEARWAQRPPAIPRRARPRADKFADERGDESDWVWVGDQRMFVVGHTSGGVPFGCYIDEIEDLP
ncbi:MAG: hypothetical protein ACRDQX_07105 [Pseudonocardiaceae bacterium]